MLAAEGPRSGPALIRLAIGTSTALAAIHDAGVVHRDFKPSNVLMAADGPRVIDFGIAKALDATGTLSSTAVGTPAYMAPEQISGAPVGPEADIFAWGTSMVFAATGRASFGQDSIPAVMHRILNLPPDLGMLAGPLRDIAGYCLIKDPSQRPTAHQILLQLLGHAGALPKTADAAQPSAMLTQGAQLAAAATPPRLAAPDFAPAPSAVPPPAPAPSGWASIQAPYVPDPGGGFQQQPAFPQGGVPYGNGPSRKDRRKGIAVLAGSAVAAVVALILVGSVIAVQLSKGDGKRGTSINTGGRFGGEFRMAVYPPTAIDPSNGPFGSDQPDDTGYNDRPVGNGPFKIESYVKNQRLVLVRNDAWAFGKTKLDRVTMELVSEAPQKGIAGVTSGSLDWAEVTAESVGSARNSTGQLLTHPPGGMNFLVPITARGPMKTKEARLAVSWALNRKTLSDSYSGGYYPPATGLVPQSFPGFKRSGICPSCEQPDLVKAKALAGQAGLKAGTKVPLVVREGSSYARWGLEVKRQLESALGWRVDLISKPSSDYTSALSAKDVSGLIALGWLPDYPSALSFLRPLLGGDQMPPTGSNYGRWSNRQFDDALRTAASSQDPQNALSSLQAAEKAALDDLALIPVWNLVHIRLASKRFVGLQVGYDGDPTLVTAALAEGLSLGA